MKIAIALLALAATAAQAEIYKCPGKDGAPVFTGTPCSKNARPLDVRPASGHGGHASAPVAGQAAPSGSLAVRAETAVQRRRLDNEIHKKEVERDLLIDEMNGKLEALRRKKALAMNNLAGATWEQSISDEMVAVSTSYEPQINLVRDELARLRAQRDRMHD
ncbi:MAG: DUF4124 domain-containing protein [Azoarcus sp.]|jgi:hypothetical protein|nr:DUF4124 domain-containing protein [Azoarcus sp.]